MLAKWFDTLQLHAWFVYQIEQPVGFVLCHFDNGSYHSWHELNHLAIFGISFVRELVHTLLTFVCYATVWKTMKNTTGKFIGYGYLFWKIFDFCTYIYDGGWNLKHYLQLMWAFMIFIKSLLSNSSLLHGKVDIRGCFKPYL